MPQPTIAEILKATGVSDTEIAALDQRIVTGITTVLTTAAQAEQKAASDREAAELAQRAQREMWDTKVAPALDAWGNEKVHLESERNFYKTQAEGAKAAGFIAKDAPGYVAPNANVNPNDGRGGDGRFVANGGVVPGSPTFMTKQEALSAVSNSTWYVTEHMRLHNGAPPPDDLETLAVEAERNRMPFRDYVAKKYDFQGRKDAIVAARQKEHDDKIIADTIAARDKHWAERSGNNPNVRPGAESQFSTLKAGVDSKSIKDPLSVSKAERHAQTSQLIQKEIADNASQTVH